MHNIFVVMVYDFDFDYLITTNQLKCFKFISNGYLNFQLALKQRLGVYDKQVAKSEQEEILVSGLD